MIFSVIICTYQRPKPLIRLLNSIYLQTNYPNQIIIVDGSLNDTTTTAVKNIKFKNLYYFKVSEIDRGLTKQRNFGIKKVTQDSEIIFFLDDDTVLEIDYFEKCIEAYNKYPEAYGIGGYIINEVEWTQVANNYTPKINEYFIDGYKRKDAARYVIRKKIGLDTNLPPCFFPKYGHGRSVSFLPPTGKTYQVEQFMGGVASFRKKLFDEFQFSTFFEGYGLYEDADFTLRISKKYPLYVATAARLSHYHDDAGRPNKFQYGKMVVRNGWYVWKIKYPKNDILSILKWHIITGILILIRFSNVINTKNKKQAFTESLGRISGWLSLWYNQPEIKQ